MMPDAVLIQVPSIDFRTFIGLSHKVLGRSPAASSDACRRELSDAERFLSCLAAMRDERAPVGLSPHLLKHVSFSAFIGADERDMLEILQLGGDAVRSGGDDCAGRAGGGRHRHPLPMAGCRCLGMQQRRPYAGAALLQQAARLVHCRRPECLGGLHARAARRTRLSCSWKTKEAADHPISRRVSPIY